MDMEDHVAPVRRHLRSVLVRRQHRAGEVHVADVPLGDGLHAMAPRAAQAGPRVDPVARREAGAHPPVCEAGARLTRPLRRGGLRTPAPGGADIGRPHGGGGGDRLGGAELLHEGLYVLLHADHPAVDVLELALELLVELLELLRVPAAVFAALDLVVALLAPDDVVISRLFLLLPAQGGSALRGDDAFGRAHLVAVLRLRASPQRRGVLAIALALGEIRVHRSAPLPDDIGKIRGRRPGEVRHPLAPVALPQHEVAQTQHQEQTQHGDVVGHPVDVQRQRPEDDARAHDQEVDSQGMQNEAEPKLRLHDPLQADAYPPLVEVLLRLLHHLVVRLRVHGDEQVQDADAEDHRAAEEDRGGDPGLPFGVLITAEGEDKVNAVAISEEQEPNGVDDDGVGIVRPGSVQGSEGVGKCHKEEHGDEEDATDREEGVEDADDLVAHLVELVGTDLQQQLHPSQAAYKGQKLAPPAVVPPLVHHRQGPHEEVVDGDVQPVHVVPAAAQVGLQAVQVGQVPEDLADLQHEVPGSHGRHERPEGHPGALHHVPLRRVHRGHEEGDELQAAEDDVHGVLHHDRLAPDEVQNRLH
mmetsp:Transcript_40782/g.120891  ORF Transcript_40782/g.120891 Transcript_40782/m.120891 type:complete len:585 (-) Transcript_40782:1176-2930(-)